MVVGEKDNLDFVFENENEDDGRVMIRLVDEGKKNPKSVSKFTSKVVSSKALDRNETAQSLVD